MERIDIIGVIGWEVSDRDIIDQFKRADGDVEVFIATPGGSVMQGTNIMNTIREYSKGEVTSIVSYAASMGTQIALSAKKVKVFDNTSFMIHNASGIAWGDYREMQKYADYLNRVNKNLAGIYAKKSGKPMEEILKLMDDETWYFGNEILENGFADEVIGDEEYTGIENAFIEKDGVKAMIEKAQDAMMKEHLKADDFAAAYKKCLGGECNLGVNPASAQITNQIKGDEMSTQTENAKEGTKPAEAQGNDPVASERERATSILALHGPDNIKTDAIAKGLSVGETAIALNAALRDTITAQKVDFEAAADEVSGITSGGEDTGLKTPENKAIEEDDEAFYKERKAK